MKERPQSQSTYMRQRFLLAFVRQLGDTGVSFTDLQKLVFLHAMSTGSAYYEFAPYRFGPYSFQLAQDVEILQRDGYAAPDATRIRATERPLSATAPLEIVEERGRTLIRKAYFEHPFYTLKSELIESHFTEKEATVFNEEKLKYAITRQILFTVGYEGKSIEGVIKILIKNDIRLLCDVRKNPLSRKFGFSKQKLKQIAETVGIKYVHIPALGIESDKRENLVTRADYQRLFEQYEQTLYGKSAELEYLHSLLCKHERVCLMCYEMESEMCHRHKIRDYLVQNNDVTFIDL